MVDVSTPEDFNMSDAEETASACAEAKDVKGITEQLQSNRMTRARTERCVRPPSEFVGDGPLPPRQRLRDISNNGSTRGLASMNENAMDEMNPPITRGQLATRSKTASKKLEQSGMSAISRNDPKNEGGVGGHMEKMLMPVSSLSSEVSAISTRRRSKAGGEFCEMPDDEGEREARLATAPKTSQRSRKHQEQSITPDAELVVNCSTSALRRSGRRPAQ